MPSVILELIVNFVFSSLDPSVASEIAPDLFMLDGHAFFFLPQKNVFCCEPTTSPGLPPFRFSVSSHFSLLLLQWGAWASALRLFLLHYELEATLCYMTLKKKDCVIAS